ncbi:MAG: hypothetical protein QOK42_378 [Frankiaceae bacterium]|nr:hypothetical protein [Frankiaceae bacterium]MDX6225257.1 hypothetical protein [Frankiales bacterium]MDX6273237.1 hypothetical protein [Frankiales bacterium]
MSVLFGPITLIFLLLSLALLALKLWALIDALIQPERAYLAADKWQKLPWVAVLAIGALLGQGLGILGIASLVAAIVYLVDVRPALREVRGR